MPVVSRELVSGGGGKTVGANRFSSKRGGDSKRLSGPKRPSDRISQRERRGPGRGGNL